MCFWGVYAASQWRHCRGARHCFQCELDSWAVLLKRQLRNPLNEAQTECLYNRSVHVFIRQFGKNIKYRRPTFNSESLNLLETQHKENLLSLLRPRPRFRFDSISTRWWLQRELRLQCGEGLREWLLPAGQRSCTYEKWMNEWMGGTRRQEEQRVVAGPYIEREPEVSRIMGTPCKQADTEAD